MGPCWAVEIKQDFLYAFILYTLDHQNNFLRLSGTLCSCYAPILKYPLLDFSNKHFIRLAWNEKQWHSVETN